MKHVPNILTVLRLFLVPCFLAASMQRMYVAAFVIFVSAAVTDVLDGNLARWFNVKSKLGALLDPAADKILMICGLVYYTFAEDLPRVRIPGWLTYAAFMRDFLIAFFAYLMYTRMHVRGFPPTKWGKASTTVQAVTLATAIAVNAFLPGWLPVVEVLFRVSLVVTLVSGWGYLRRAALMLRDDAPARA